jgi:hypothetical protein
MLRHNVEKGSGKSTLPGLCGRPDSPVLLTNTSQGNISIHTTTNKSIYAVPNVNISKPHNRTEKITVVLMVQEDKIIPSTIFILPLDSLYVTLLADVSSFSELG